MTPGSIVGTGFLVMNDVPQMAIVAKTPAWLVRCRSTHGSPTAFRFAKEYNVDSVPAGDMEAQGDKMTDYWCIQQSSRWVDAAVLLQQDGCHGMRLQNVM